MLRTQDANTDPPTPVSQARVTPEELTQALAAIESRKQAEASRLAGTIPIGDAIADLHLDSTPEDIWAEVQAQRAKADASQAQSSPEAARRVRKRQAKAAEQAKQQATERQRSPRGRRWLRVAVPVLFVWLLMQNGLIPHHFWTHTGHVAAPILRPLAQVPDGQEVYADDSALVQVSEGKPSAQITVSENESGNRWKIFRRSGHVYLRGYIESADSLQPLQGKPLNVYNDDNSGELHGDLTSNITLRVDNVPLQKSGGDGDFSGITVTNFQPDPLTTLSPWR